ncbi:MAG: dethiobiotin synthase [Gammaproteobacteria bacterium]|nr:dethiobiotin synthase [Gammaproteobacteria bacterium]
MTAGVFITGTDTGSGKTFVSAGLLRGLSRRGLRAAGMKPVASGCERGPTGGWINADAQALQAASAGAWDYAVINPYALPEPMAPQFAAERHGCEIELAPIVAAYRQLCAASDRVVVEGIGGWRVPLSASLATRDLVARLELPVILVVGLRLGCINHALMTAEALAADGVRFLGWVANHFDPDYTTAAETLATLNAGLAAPLLAQVPTGAGSDDPCWDRLAACLDHGR